MDHLYWLVKLIHAGCLKNPNLYAAHFFVSWHRRIIKQDLCSLRTQRVFKDQIASPIWQWISCLCWSIFSKLHYYKYIHFMPRLASSMHVSATLHEIKMHVSYWKKPLKTRFVCWPNTFAYLGQHLNNKICWNQSLAVSIWLNVRIKSRSFNSIYALCTDTQMHRV